MKTRVRYFEISKITLTNKFSTSISEQNTSTFRATDNVLA